MISPNLRRLTRRARGFSMSSTDQRCDVTPCAAFHRHRAFGKRRRAGTPPRPVIEVVVMVVEADGHGRRPAPRCRNQILLRIVDRRGPW